MQKVEKLLSITVMGQQKQPELLAEMLRFCPRGEENSFFFNCLFLQKLPRELRVLLSEAYKADKRLLSEQADQIWAHNSHLHHDTVAPVSSEPDDEGAVAVVQPARGGQNGCRFPHNRRGRGAANSGQT
jgi:hypothetical protein